MARTWQWTVAAALAVTVVLLLAGGVLAADPAGTATIKRDPQAAVNFTWTLVAAFLVFFMQAGFALLGAGLIRSKNTVNYLTKSYMDFCMAALSFWAFGFALMFGGSKLAPGLDLGNRLVGLSGFFLTGQGYDVTTAMLWFFQMVFAATAATIVAGAVAERMRITAYLAYSFLIGALIYPVYGHWVWSGGWLAALPWGAGAKDFAGSGVVHAVGGLVALAGAAMVGPRTGKFNPDGTPNVIPGHNTVYVVLGAFILFFGWFGFNPGSTLMATELRIAVIAVNTLLAGAAGAVAALYAGLVRTGKADIVLACNGSLAGLVGITAGCAYVAPWAAVVIGAVAPFVMMATSSIVERRLHVDDPVGAVGVHAGGGLWGLLAVGLFADGTYGGVRGLITGAWGQLAAQLISMVAVTAWALGTGFLMFWLLRVTMGLRASREEELAGLDVPEHGIEAYPEAPPARPAVGWGSAAAVGGT
ncbi:MAG: ammonium transporter [Armatimonadota bacterium]|nr:ammonium transporter [Armatimonadota bacterium]MDR7488078.1 ammonium transporter [Armatimonadota bacterium]MDR7503106.1 ammonium transporter [Armatimonadota bacterium]MDR7528827.1 ammonium transporter [Armatimonadota bacterium]